MSGKFTPDQMFSSLFSFKMSGFANGISQHRKIRIGAFRQAARLDFFVRKDIQVKSA